MTVYTAPNARTAAAMASDRATWLPVREVIRSAGHFALSRMGGDNALAAYVTGLASVGITLPEQSATVVRYEACYSTTIGITLTAANGDNDSALMEWNRYRQNSPMRRSDAVRRVNALMRAQGYNDLSMYAGYAVNRQEDDGSTTPFVMIELSWSRTMTSDQDDAHAIEMTFRADSARAADVIVRMVQRDLGALGIITSRPEWGQNEPYSNVARQRRSDRLSSRVEAAANNADALAGERDYLPTDEFLAMMRNQAVSNAWCPEHHSIIQRLTNGTRRPYGVTAEIEISVQQRVSVDVNSFYGGDGSPDAIRQRLERIGQATGETLRNYFDRGAINWHENDSDVSVTLSEGTDGYVPPLTTITPAELQMHPDAIVRGDAPTPLEINEWESDDSDEDAAEPECRCDDCRADRYARNN